MSSSAARRSLNNPDSGISTGAQDHKIRGFPSAPLDEFGFMWLGIFKDGAFGAGVGIDF